MAIENSDIVYDDRRVPSVLSCNWFWRTRRPYDPNSDSSIQSYANIYDMELADEGTAWRSPGVERRYG